MSSSTTTSCDWCALDAAVVSRYCRMRDLARPCSGTNSALGGDDGSVLLGGEAEDDDDVLEVDFDVPGADGDEADELDDDCLS